VKLISIGTLRTAEASLNEHLHFAHYLFQIKIGGTLFK